MNRKNRNMFVCFVLFFFYFIFQKKCSPPTDNGRRTAFIFHYLTRVCVPFIEYIMYTAFNRYYRTSSGNSNSRFLTFEQHHSNHVMFVTIVFYFIKLIYFNVKFNLLIFFSLVFFVLINSYLFFIIKPTIR